MADSDSEPSMAFDVDAVFSQLKQTDKIALLSGKIETTLMRCFYYGR